MNPGYVFIGDSMTGTRIDEGRLGALAGRPVITLLQAGSGSAFWYLALKNWVIASGVRPRAVFVLFRDTNLTDVLFRLDQTFRWSVDKVALDREDELNAVIAARVSTPSRCSFRFFHISSQDRSSGPRSCFRRSSLRGASRSRRCGAGFC